MCHTLWNSKTRTRVGWGGTSDTGKGTDGWPAHPEPDVLRPGNISTHLHTFLITSHAWLWPGGGRRYTHTPTHPHTLPTERETDLVPPGNRRWQCLQHALQIVFLPLSNPCTAHKLFFIHATEDPIPVAHPGATMPWNTSRWNIKGQIGSDSLLKAQQFVCCGGGAGGVLWWGQAVNIS